MTSLYLIRGIPGSGKSTFASLLFMSGIVQQAVEADDYFMRPDGSYVFDPAQLGAAHSHCQQKTREYLSLGYSVAVSNTSTTESEVDVYAKIAERYGAQFISIIMENRHGSSNVHSVPQEAINRMKQRFSVQL